MRSLAIAAFICYRSFPHAAPCQMSISSLYPCLETHAHIRRYVNEAQLLASIDVHLLKHSTGQPHPAAAKPVLHFENIHYLPGHCSSRLEISGDSLCFLLNNYFPFINADPVTFIVYNWKTGQPIIVSLIPSRGT